jgi:hypothetical protein
MGLQVDENPMTGLGFHRDPLRELRRIAAQLGLSGVESSPPAAPCLNDDAVAMIAAGDVTDSAAHAEMIRHLSECSDCRKRLATVAHLLDDSEIAAEIDQLGDPQERGRFGRRRIYQISAAAMLAVAAVAILLVRPESFSSRDAVSPNAVQMSREEAVSTVAAPRILSPATVASSTDSLRWTGVPQADLYRIRIWNRDGEIVWATDTRDTTLPMPAELAREGGTYLWEVKARTGWDRWVTSDFLEFTVRSNTH